MKWILCIILLSHLALAEDLPHCGEKSAGELQQFFQTINDSLGQVTLKNGYYQTAYNLKIEENCQERMPIKKLEKFYRETMTKGEQCLRSLSHLGASPQENLKCLSTLFADKNNPPKLLCGGWPFGKDIYAVASFPGSSKRHPYLWLSPHVSELIKTDPQELRATIFHEMLHNCGHIHSEGLEITWTCEECCMNDKLAGDKKQSACNICGGKYPHENDEGYAKDLMNWSKDYKNLGVNARVRLYEVAITMKNHSMLKSIIQELPWKHSQKEKLAEILGHSPQNEINQRYKDFIKQEKIQGPSMNQQALEKYLKLQ